MFWRHVLAPVSAGDPAFAEGSALIGDLIQTESQSLSGHERNRLLQNLGDGRFAEVGAVAGVDLEQDGRGVVAGDVRPLSDIPPAGRVRTGVAVSATSSKASLSHR